MGATVSKSLASKMPKKPPKRTVSGGSRIPVFSTHGIFGDNPLLAALPRIDPGDYLAVGNGPCGFYLKEPKTGSSARTIPLTRHTYDVLRAVRADSQQRARNARCVGRLQACWVRSGGWRSES